MLVQHFLENSARRLPDKVALICGEERLTYREIDGRANSVAGFLREQGVERQDRVAILLDNSTESVISLWGILKADAIFIMLSPTMKAHKLSYILNDCQVKALITHTNKARVVTEAISGAESLEQVLWVGKTDAIPSPSGASAKNHEFSEALSFTPSALCSMPYAPTSMHHAPCSMPSSNIDLDLAALIYTSGSTGEPKGVMLTHHNMVSAATSITTYLQNIEDDIVINLLPLSFDYGLYQVLMAFKFGGTVVLEKSFTFPYKVIEKMVQEKVTGFPGVPTIFAILLGLKDLNKFDFSNLRYISNTAAALPPAYIERLRKIFPHVQIYSMYGLTECKRVSFLPPEEIDLRPGSVGQGMPNEEVWVEGDNGERLGPGVVGELVVRGSNVMRGYWGLLEETARVLKPGKYPGEVVLRTGDLFKADDEGFLYFVGRKDDMIKSRGERISPKEIEQCLCSVDEVAEAAVIGVPDEILGQAIVAYVRSQDSQNLTDKQVQKYCRLHLEDFMIPQAVYFVESFPQTSSGKIDKLALRANWSEVRGQRSDT
jgi:amino acid adenylation domain-containing protein